MADFYKRKSLKQNSANRDAAALSNPSKSLICACEAGGQLIKGEVRKNLNRALCTLKRRTGVTAPGVLCDKEFGGRILHLFATTYIEPRPEDLCKAVLNFPFLKNDTGINIVLPLNSIISFWGDSSLNSTLIELSSEAADDCKSWGACFLKVGIASVDTEVRHIQYCTVQLCIVSAYAVTLCRV